MLRDSPVVVSMPWLARVHALLLTPLVLVFLSAGCARTPATNSVASARSMRTVAVTEACAVSQLDQEVRLDLKPWYVNAERTIWAHFWTDRQLKPAYGYKVLWIRPEPFPGAEYNDAVHQLATGHAGTEFAVSARRLDANAPPIEFSMSGVDPQGYQPSTVSFPTAGCWEVNANASGTSLRFIVEVK
jgi:hypothetical protein